MSMAGTPPGSSSSESEDNTPAERRQRRTWSEEEDDKLRAAILLVEGNLGGRPRQWHLISQHVPGRSNKDCRKRWYGQMERPVKRGAWTPEEDQLLLRAVRIHGNQWALIAAAVGTRSGDQCAKRWTDAINPNIDHSEWKPEEDQLLFQGVKDFGRSWAQIVRELLPRRTGLAAKNRYNMLTRPPPALRPGQRSGKKSRPKREAVVAAALRDEDAQDAERETNEAHIPRRAGTPDSEESASTMASLKTEAVSPVLHHPRPVVATFLHALPVASDRQPQAYSMPLRSRADPSGSAHVSAKANVISESAAGGAPPYVPYDPYNPISPVVAPAQTHNIPRRYDYPSQEFTLRAPPQPTPVKEEEEMIDSPQSLNTASLLSPQQAVAPSWWAAAQTGYSSMSVQPPQDNPRFLTTTLSNNLSSNVRPSLSPLDTSTRDASLHSPTSVYTAASPQSVSSHRYAASADNCPIALGAVPEDSVPTSCSWPGKRFHPYATMALRRQQSAPQLRPMVHGSTSAMRASPASLLLREIGTVQPPPQQVYSSHAALVELGSTVPSAHPLSQPLLPHLYQSQQSQTTSLTATSSHPYVHNQSAGTYTGLYPGTVPFSHNM